MSNEQKIFTQTALIDLVRKETGLKKDDAQGLVENIFNEMKQALTEGRRIQISDFGSFTAVVRGERSARNPQTGEPMVIPARWAVTFKPSKKFIAEMPAPQQKAA